MRHLLQSVFALAVLIGLPVFVEAPHTTAGMVAASIGALLLLAAAIHGFVGFVRSRKQRVFLDSAMPSKHVDLERTVVKPKPKDG